MRSAIKSIKSAKQYFTLKGKKGRSTFDENITFTHLHALQAIRRIERSGNISPLLFLYKDIKQFKYITKDQFVKEVCIALFIAQKNIVINLLQMQKLLRCIKQLICYP